MPKFDITTWLTNNYIAHIGQYLKKYRESGNKIWSVYRIYHEKHFFLKNRTQCDRETIPRLFSKRSNLIISLDQ